MTGNILNWIKMLRNGWNYKKARFWFWPILSGFTVSFGIFSGPKGALVGFMYGIVAGLFLIHESLPANIKKRSDRKLRYP
jgi:hypothetical protein